MAHGKYLSLEEARKTGKLAQAQLPGGVSDTPTPRDAPQAAGNGDGAGHQHLSRVDLRR